MKRGTWVLGIVVIVFAVLWFASGALRMGVMMLRANVGLYEALILAVLGAILLLTSRRR